MTSVTGKTSAAIDALVATLLASAIIDVDGHLKVTTHNGTVTDLGPVVTSLPVASETAAGILKIATSAQITAGTDDTTAVSPSHLATAQSGKQPLNTHLTAIAGLAASNSDIMQYESGEWTNRTPAQVAVDIVSANPIVQAKLYSGSAYSNPTSPFVYVGSVDPSGSLAVNNGSVWFDTSGV